MKSEENESISAFAFKTGKMIEGLIIEKTNNLEEENRFLQAKILNWFGKTKDQEFAKYFNITTVTKATV